MLRSFSGWATRLVVWRPLPLYTNDPKHKLTVVTTEASPGAVAEASTLSCWCSFSSYLSLRWGLRKKPLSIFCCCCCSVWFLRWGLVLAVLEFAIQTRFGLCLPNAGMKGMHHHTQPNLSPFLRDVLRVEAMISLDYESGWKLGVWNCIWALLESQEN